MKSSGRENLYRPTSAVPTPSMPLSGMSAASNRPSAPPMARSGGSSANRFGDPSKVGSMSSPGVQRRSLETVLAVEQSVGSTTTNDAAKRKRETLAERLKAKDIYARTHLHVQLRRARTSFDLFGFRELAEQAQLNSPSASVALNTLQVLLGQPDRSVSLRKVPNLISAFVSYSQDFRRVCNMALAQFYFPVDLAIPSTVETNTQKPAPLDLDGDFILPDDARRRAPLNRASSSLFWERSVKGVDGVALETFLYVRSLGEVRRSARHSLPLVRPRSPYRLWKRVSTAISAAVAGPVPYGAHPFWEEESPELRDAYSNPWVREYGTPPFPVSSFAPPRGKRVRTVQADGASPRIRIMLNEEKQEHAQKKKKRKKDSAEHDNVHEEDSRTMISLLHMNPLERAYRAVNLCRSVSQMYDNALVIAQNQRCLSMLFSLLASSNQVAFLLRTAGFMGMDFPSLLFCGVSPISSDVGMVTSVAFRPSSTFFEFPVLHQTCLEIFMMCAEYLNPEDENECPRWFLDYLYLCIVTSGLDPAEWSAEAEMDSLPEDEESTPLPHLILWRGRTALKALCTEVDLGVADYSFVRHAALHIFSKLISLETRSHDREAAMERVFGSKLESPRGRRKFVLFARACCDMLCVPHTSVFLLGEEVRNDNPTIPQQYRLENPRKGGPEKPALTARRIEAWNPLPSTLFLNGLNNDSIDAALSILSTFLSMDTEPYRSLIAEERHIIPALVTLLMALDESGQCELVLQRHGSRVPVSVPGTRKIPLSLCLNARKLSEKCDRLSLSRVQEMCHGVTGRDSELGGFMTAMTKKRAALSLFHLSRVDSIRPVLRSFENQLTSVAMNREVSGDLVSMLAGATLCNCDPAKDTPVWF